MSPLVVDCVIGCLRRFIRSPPFWVEFFHHRNVDALACGEFRAAAEADAYAYYFVRVDAFFGSEHLLVVISAIFALHQSFSIVLI